MLKKILPILAFLVILIVGLSSCVKKKFDNPPDSSSYDPNIPTNKTILGIKDLYTGLTTLIDSDYVISGIVTADDRSGCFYKQIVIQDSTSGIVVLLGRSGLYTDFPIGRRVYIKCKGLYIGAYGGFVQLGSTPDIDNSVTDIPSASIAKYLIKGSTGHKVTPRVVTINDLKTFNTTSIKWLGTLIQIDSAQFIMAEVGSPYAQDPNISSGTDRNIEDCIAKKIVVRMSGYANFRNELLPTGKGPLTAIYSRYNSTPQLLIRDTTDVKLNGPRCGGVVIQPAVNIGIDSLRRMYNGTGIVIGSYKIHGVVTSSYADSNISKGGIYLQDETGRGINIYYGGTIAYKLGDSLTVDVTGDSLILYKGLMEVDKVSAKTTVVASGKTVVPKLVTIAQLNTDLNQTASKDKIYESTVVKIMGCTISGTPATYSGSKTITDATGNMVLYTRNSPPYSTTNYPTTIVNVTGLASIFNTTNQILIRTLSDVQ